jgi:hypothetical protein
MEEGNEVRQRQDLAVWRGAEGGRAVFPQRCAMASWLEPCGFFLLVEAASAK